MSYILDALKKSDRERKQGEVPDLQSDHGLRFGHGKREKRSSLWIWLSGGALLSLSALVLYWGMQRNSVALQEKISALEKSVVQLKEQPAPVAVHPPAVKGEAVLQPLMSEEKDDSAVMPSPAVHKKAVLQPLVVETGDDKGLVEQPVIEEKTVIKPEDVPRKSQLNVVAPPPPSVASEIASEKVEMLPLVQDLPASVQKILPPLKLAGHVYAKDATKRMIMINNRICREGDLIENQLVLEQIVWEGVVLRYQDIRFRMNIL
ncbi:MAG: general secretion pathway protein GspB [Deltaproteobacteria bacterium]|nr:general secretion pathway protein GspB [Deltaproteobacteria bacterium]